MAKKDKNKDKEEVTDTEEVDATEDLEELEELEPQRTLDNMTEEEIAALSEEELAELQELQKQTKKKKKQKIILLVLVIILLGGTGAFFAGVFGGGDDYTSLEEGDPLADAASKGADTKAQNVFMNMPDITVNLNSNSRRPHFINLKLTLELAKQEDVAKIEAQMPRIIDAFNTYLREMRKEDLQGSAGLYRLEHEMMLRLQKTLTEGEITDILFREIIIQ